MKKEVIDCMAHPQNNDQQQNHLMKKKTLTKNLQTEEESEDADIKELEEEAKN
jgi:hypothetical protein